MTAKLSYLNYKALNPDAAFTDWLVACCASSWEEATRHPFTCALGDGTLDCEDYKSYLLQDFAFIQDLATALGHLIAKAPTMEAKRHLSAFCAALTSGENDYFIRSFEALGVTKEQVSQAQEGSVLRKLTGALLSASGNGTYEDGLACLLCAEWIYREWGVHEARKNGPPQFYYREWIDLHSGHEFEAFVNWLISEMNQYGVLLSQSRQAEVAERFINICQLEAAFFDSVLRSPIPCQDEEPTLLIIDQDD
ncbi:TenA family protein [Polycladidibacter stylochi]|uniref:TenA family protein n=1 Tax=Polycladidibacter stylochi TaxID=1807766 RepID=UPI0009E6AA05|nr:TenA family protein [Pseudovibrio stylochi]